MEVTKLTDMLCKILEDDARKKNDPWWSLISTRETCGEDKLKRNTGPDGRTNRPTTAKQRDSGRRVGVAVVHQHCARIKCLKRDGHASCVQT